MGGGAFACACHPRTCTVCTNNTYLHANECKGRCPDGGLTKCMAVFFWLDEQSIGKT